MPTNISSFFKKSLLIIVLTISLSMITGSVQAFETAVDPTTGASYAKGEFIVKYKDWNKRSPKTLAKNHGKDHEVKLENDKAKTVLIKVADENLESFLANAKTVDTNVAYIEPNFVVKGAAIPLDSMYAADQTVMWNGQSRYEPLIGANVQEDLRFDHAWDTTTGSNTIKIAVLDSGINPNHQELTGKVVAAQNFYTPGASPNDDHGHGTAVASIIAAATNFSTVTTGMAGSCPNCLLLNAKVLDSNNNGTISSVANGLYWAKDQGAHVINVSIYIGSTQSLALYDALQYVKAGGNNVTVVVAAGNVPSELIYPGLYPSTVSVGWLSANGSRYPLSGYGDWVDVMAYGSNILGAVHFNNTSYLTTNTGSSFAAPFASGVAGLMYSRGDLPATDRANYVRKTMMQSARLTSAASQSNRVLNAQGAVTSAWVAETATNNTVKFYVYQDNNNSTRFDIGDVCIKSVPLSMQQYIGGSWSATTGVSAPGGNPEIATDAAKVASCMDNGGSQTLVIDRVYKATNSVSDNATTGSLEFLPDYYQLKAGVKHEKYGDCNGDGKIDAGDLTATSLEIFDGDGNNWLNTQGGTSKFYRFCDSNRDTIVDAGDISCTSSKIFNPAFVCGP